MPLNVIHAKVIFPTPEHKKRQRLERDIAGLQLEYDSAMAAAEAQKAQAQHCVPLLEKFKAELEEMGDAGIDQPDEAEPAS